MAYNPSLYNPYGSQQFQPTISYPQQFQPTMQPQYQQQFAAQQQQQPINGLTFIDIDNIDSYQMPAGSVSQPLFVDAEHFVIKTFDLNGGSSTEAYKATKIPLSSLLGSGNDNNVTRADLEAFKADIMEAINGKHSIADVPAKTTADTQ
jgi:hypothetical protein